MTSAAPAIPVVVTAYRYHGMSYFRDGTDQRRAVYCETTRYELTAPGSPFVPLDKMTAVITPVLMRETIARLKMDERTRVDFVNHFVPWAEWPMILSPAVLVLNRGNGWYDIHADVPVCRTCFCYMATRPAPCGHLVQCLRCDGPIRCDDCAAAAAAASATMVRK